MIISNPAIPTELISVEGEIFKLSVRAIGVWDMDLTPSVNVDVSDLPFAIRMIEVYIYNDGLTELFPLNYGETVVGNYIPAGRWNLDKTLHLVGIGRRTGGMFDSVAFNDGVQTRGHVYIWYLS